MSYSKYKKILSFERSFASYTGETANDKLKVDCWDTLKNNNIKPRQIAKNSHKKCWFNCDRCNHSFDTRLDNVCKNSWCPYCSIQVKKLCDEKDCNHCFERSFASYTETTANDKLKVDCWDTLKNNNMKPRQTAKNSNKKCWFNCDRCNHSFDTRLGDVVCNNNWCPYCKNKTELKLYNWFTENLQKRLLRNIPDNCKSIELKVKREYKPKWCSTEYYDSNKKLKKGRYQYRYDFLLTFILIDNNNEKLECKVIVELDGRQHFEQVSNWESPLLQQIRDKYKEFKARKHGIALIRCFQKDVYYNRNNWDQNLIKDIRSTFFY